MNKQELRIGNYIAIINRDTAINYVEDYAMKVVEINTFDLAIIKPKENLAHKKEVLIKSLADVSGIKITFDILTNLGFKDLSHDKNKWGCRIEVNASDELCWYRQDNNIRYQTKGNGFTRDYNIKYVHQLQNLYFALTGEELVFSEA